MGCLEAFPVQKKRYCRSIFAMLIVKLISENTNKTITYCDVF